MKALIAVLSVVLLSGCAGMEHSRIVAERQATSTYVPMGVGHAGFGGDQQFLRAATHGAAWWVGTNELKKILRK